MPQFGIDCLPPTLQVNHLDRMMINICIGKVGAFMRGHWAGPLMVRVLSGLIAALALIALYLTARDYKAANGTVMLALAAMSHFYSHWAMLAVLMSYLYTCIGKNSVLISFLSGNAVILLSIMTVMFLIINGWRELIYSPIRLKIEHGLVPLLVAIHWIILTPRALMQPVYAIWWTAQPIIYTGHSLIRGAYSGIYPYDLADASKHGYFKVLSIILVITAASIITGYAVIGINNRLLSRGTWRWFGDPTTK